MTEWADEELEWYEHGDRQLCERRDDGTWTIRQCPQNRGRVGLDCDRRH